MRVAVIGLGSITRGVLAALAQAPEVDDLVATRRREHPEPTLPPTVSVLTQERHPSANVEAVRGADVVVLCVKPHQVREVLAEVREDLAPDATVVSVAAGIGFDVLRSALGPGPRLVRLMPNTAAGVGQGVIGLLLEAPDPRWQERLASWFEAVGTVVPLPDEQAVDALSAVAGSGPAYVFRLLEAMTHAAVELGLEPDEASRVCRQVVLGAAAQLQDAPSIDAPALRRAVTSPGGTTEQAMAVIDRAGPDAVMAEAFRAAVDHAARLNATG